VLRLPKSCLEVEQRSEVTPYGGLALAVALCRRLKVAQSIDQHVKVLKVHLPYTESDHVLAMALSLYCGGTCLEDQANLQHSEAALRILGACRLPDPTTAGDFLRRFDEHGHDSLPGLRRANDELQSRAWKAAAHRRGKRKDRGQWAMVDVDGHVKQLCGVQKQGADFFGKTWCYLPLLVSLANTGECLAVRNRPGNIRTSDDTAPVLAEVLPRVSAQYGRVLVRGDSDFDRRDIRQACTEAGAYFAFVGREFTNRPGIAEAISEETWRPFRTRAHRQRVTAGRRPGYRRRRHGHNRRQQRARERGFKDMQLIQQWLAEVPYTPPDARRPYRLIIRRQLIKHHKGQQLLFEQYRYRYVVTNLPRSVSATKVVDLTYERCDQEKQIQQMGAGLAAWRMPVAEFDGNSAWLEVARLAWNLAKWLAMLALPDETVRWQWKRFRQAFVYVAAQVLRRSRQITVRMSASHRWCDTLVAAHMRLQT
jgi:hypothetical protein